MKMLKIVHLRILLLLAVAIAVPVVGFSLDSATSVWTFDDDPPESFPPEFQVGTLFDGRPAGEWKVVETEKAKSSPHVFGQLQGKGAEHAYKIALVNGTDSSDFDLRVSLLPISGKADMGGGLIWRATDDRNYYLVRANPLEQNLRIYRVVKGVRHMLENVNQIIEVTKWHTLHVEAKGCRLQVSYDDKPVFDLCDRTFTRGRVGLWTKSDAVSYFDDLHLKVLD
jgi:hypothetical protein